MEYTSLPLMWWVTEGRYKHRWTHRIRMNYRDTYDVYIYVYIYIRTCITYNIYLHTSIHYLLLKVSLSDHLSRWVFLGLRQVHGPQTPFFGWRELGWSGSTISTLLNGTINPKDGQVASPLVQGFSIFLGVFQVTMAKPVWFLIIWDYWSLLEMGAAVSWNNQDKMLGFLSVCCLNSELWRTLCDQAEPIKKFSPWLFEIFVCGLL